MERIIYDQMNQSDMDHLTMNIHLHCYAFAHQYILHKKILDAACGTCFGTMIYSTAAESIVAIDKSRSAIDRGKKLPFFCPTTFIVKNLDKQKLPGADVCVSVETIEHLNGDGFFLQNLNVGALVFTVPIDMYSSGGFHKMNFKTVDDVSKYLNKNGWRIASAMQTTRKITASSPVGVTGVLSDSLMGVAERI